MPINDLFNGLINQYLFKTKGIIKMPFFHLYPFVQSDTALLHKGLKG